MRTDVCQKPQGMARARESYIANLLVCNTVLYQVSCIQKEPVLCPRAFCSLWVEFLQLLGQQCASVRLFARIPKKRGKPSDSSEHNLWTKRTESLSDGKKMGRGVGEPVFIIYKTDVLDHILYVTNLCLLSLNALCCVLYSWISSCFYYSWTMAVFLFPYDMPVPISVLTVSCFSSIPLSSVLRLLKTILKDQ